MMEVEIGRNKHGKRHKRFGVLYWLWGRDGDRGGRPSRRPHVVSHRGWVVGAAGDGFDHFGHLKMKGRVGRTFREQSVEVGNFFFFFFTVP